MKTAVKRRITVSIAERELKQLRERAARERLSLSSLAAEIISSSLKGTDGEAVIEMVQRELARLSARQRATRKDLETLGDLIAFYVLYYFCQAPPIRESERASIYREGKARFDKFLGALKTRRDAGQSFFDSLLDGTTPTGEPEKETIDTDAEAKRQAEKRAASPVENSKNQESTIACT